MGGAARPALAFLAACCLVSGTTGVPAWAAATLLITAVIVHTTGELWHAAAGFEVSFALAPEHATGQYLGVFGLGAGLAEAFGPALLIGLCIEWGRPGWYVTGAMFAVTGAAVPAAVRYAERHRSPRPQNGNHARGRSPRPTDPRPRRLDDRPARSVHHSPRR
ncbi:hypothetical protein GCM10020218_069580 [Dactylosporangium vinaceum]